MFRPRTEWKFKLTINSNGYGYERTRTFGIHELLFDPTGKKRANSAFIVFPGFGCTGIDFGLFIRSLQSLFYKTQNKKIDFYTVDFPGFGQKDNQYILDQANQAKRKKPDQSAEILLNDLLEITNIIYQNIASLYSGSVNFLGHSLGSAIVNLHISKERIYDTGSVLIAPFYAPLESKGRNGNRKTELDRAEMLVISRLLKLLQEELCEKSDKPVNNSQTCVILATKDTVVDNSITEDRLPPSQITELDILHNFTVRARDVNLVVGHIAKCFRF